MAYSNRYSHTLKSHVEFYTQAGRLTLHILNIERDSSLHSDHEEVVSCESTKRIRKI